MLTKILKFSKLIFIPALFLTLLFSFSQTGQIETLANDLTANELICQQTGQNCSDFDQLESEAGIVIFLIGIASFLTFIAGGVAVVFMVWGGMLYITANGDTEKIDKGKSILVNASMGLVITIIAYTIVVIINNLASGDFLNNFFT